MFQRTVPHASDLDPGDVIARDFEIVRLAGRGSFSTVYEAQQLSRKRRRVAVKVLHQGIQHELERQADSFVQNPYLVEQALSQRVVHPVVCRVYRVGTSDGRFYAALEWAPGTTLDRLVQERRGALPLQTGAEVIAQLGSALSAMHRQQVVHRDLKPSNVMVLDQEGRISVKLIDFGIAKNAGEAENHNQIGTGSLLVGTPAYMAPEQATGRVTDTRSDLYSLAALSYEMLTGQRHIQPRGGARGAEAYLEYLKSALPIPTHPACHVRRDLPPDVDEILASGLARDRHLRPATVEQFCDDLEVVLRAAAPIERRVSFFSRAMDRLRSAPRIRTEI